MFKILDLKNRHTGCPRCNNLGCCWAREKHGENIGHWFWALEFYWSRFKKTFNPMRVHEYLTRLDYSKIEDVEVSGIDYADYPDFCDAYIESATYKGREMNERELEKLNDDRDFVYERTLEVIQ